MGAITRSIRKRTKRRQRSWVAAQESDLRMIVLRAGRSSSRFAFLSNRLCRTGFSPSSREDAGYARRALVSVPPEPCSLRKDSLSQPSRTACEYGPPVDELAQLQCQGNDW